MQRRTVVLLLCLIIGLVCFSRSPIPQAQAAPVTETVPSEAINPERRSYKPLAFAGIDRSYGHWQPCPCRHALDLLHQDRRRAFPFAETPLGVQQSPPNPVLSGIALLMTMYVMFPTVWPCIEPGGDLFINRCPQ